MSKIIKFNRDAKEKLQLGINKVNDAVAVTMGPYGRNVLIEREYGQVSSTKDGVTVAKTITLEDPIENMAATVIKQASSKTVDQAGDGTTTSTVLAHSIATLALQSTSYATANATQIKRGIEAAVKDVVDELNKMSVKIGNEDQIKQIATLSANGDIEIGELVSAAIEKVGRDGVVTVEESRSGETSLEVVEGLQFERGYKSPYFVTDNSTMTAVLNDPLILLMDGRLNQSKDLLPLLEAVSQQNKSLLIVAEDFGDEVLSLLVVNKMRGILKVAAVKAPDFGDRRTLILEDLAILTGATVVSNQKGHRLDKFNKDWFGQARTVTVGKDVTTVVDGKGKAEDVEKRVLELKSQIDLSSSPYEIEKLQERLSKLIGGVAIINVGGGTEVEMREKKDRLDDALQATKAAIEEGILPGAGIALLQARKVLADKLGGKDDFTKGIEIVFQSCGKPFRQILSNAGEDYNEWWMQLSKTKNMVPDISKGMIVDAYDSGIIDPTKVVRCALENAAHAAVTLLMTECVIHEKPSDKKQEGVDLSEMGM